MGPFLILTFARGRDSEEDLICLGIDHALILE